eukprot:scaffold4745_cov125-Isochrysis_galbana.AAC.11
MERTKPAQSSSIRNGVRITRSRDDSRQVAWLICRRAACTIRAWVDGRKSRVRIVGQSFERDTASRRSICSSSRGSDRAAFGKSCLYSGERSRASECRRMPKSRWYRTNQLARGRRSATNSWTTGSGRCSAVRRSIRESRHTSSSTRLTASSDKIVVTGRGGGGGRRLTTAPRTRFESTATRFPARPKTGPFAPGCKPCAPTMDWRNCGRRCCPARDRRYDRGGGIAGCKTSPMVSVIAIIISSWSQCPASPRWRPIWRAPRTHERHHAKTRTNTRTHVPPLAHNKT